MHKFRIHSILVFLCLTFGFSTISARTSMASGTLSRVPADSILVLSVDGEKMISKSGILKNKQWNPINGDKDCCPDHQTLDHSKQEKS